MSSASASLNLKPWTRTTSTQGFGIYILGCRTFNLKILSPKNFESRKEGLHPDWSLEQWGPKVA